MLNDKSSALLENLIAVELSREYGEIYYMKSAKTGIDVDFYVPELRWAIQVAYSVKGEARDREIGGLLKLADKFPEVQRLTVVTWDEQESVASGRLPIEVMPAYRFLLSEMRS